MKKNIAQLFHIDEKETEITPNSVQMKVLSRCCMEASSSSAFVSDREQNREIYVMNADGTVQINITNNQGDDFLPDWSSRR